MVRVHEGALVKPCHIMICDEAFLLRPEKKSAALCRRYARREIGKTDAKESLQDASNARRPESRTGGADGQISNLVRRSVHKKPGRTGGPMGRMVIDIGSLRLGGRRSVEPQLPLLPSGDARRGVCAAVYAVVLGVGFVLKRASL